MIIVPTTIEIKCSITCVALPKRTPPFYNQMFCLLLHLNFVSIFFHSFSSAEVVSATQSVFLLVVLKHNVDLAFVNLVLFLCSLLIFQCFILKKCKHNRKL